ncbi:MAG: MBL fold metallo-hydrolase [Nitrososphaerota archaeon]|nr:MBL fold metallo-hydrolase [Candidatus Bathyarchaeota archaeon]MDW8049100.1 MBL fold metallo-hydrolase [Nitrososphaerota archaeon]
MVKGLRFTVIVEDTLSKKLKSFESLRVEHGLSFYLKLTSGEGKDHCIIVDTGPPSSIVVQNAEVLHVDLGRTDTIVLTHGHYDHIGGLLSLLRHINKRIPIIAHPRIFEPKLAYKPFLTSVGAPFSKHDVEAVGGLLILSRNPIAISEDVFSTGEIERVTGYEDVKGFWTVSRERFIEDMMIDEQALVIKVDGKGLVIISGCSHSGIINAIHYAKKMMKVEKIYAVVGGLHLSNASEERIKKTMEDLKKIDPEILYLGHCTGKKAVETLRESFGDRCETLFTGLSVNL